MHPNCGKLTPVEYYRINSQQNASHGEHPWLAILKDDDNNTFCGGSLINSQFVITGKKHIESVEQSLKLIILQLLIALNNT